MPETFYFFVMLLSFILFAAIKIPISVSLMFAAICGAFFSGDFFSAGGHSFTKKEIGLPGRNPSFICAFHCSHYSRI